MSDFLAEGFESMPNIYGDNQQVRDFYDWDQERLEGRIAEYNAFLSRPNNMPRAIAGASRVVMHAMFELSSKLIDECNEEKERE